MKAFTFFVRASISMASLVLLGCADGRQGDEGEAEGVMPRAVVSVTTAPIEMGNADVTVTAVGRTEATRKEKLYSPVAGKIMALKVLEGSAVKSGDVVALLLPKESQAALAGAEALIRNATTDAQRAEAERMRTVAASSQNLVRLTAKFDGVVSTRSVTEGELVQENAELLSIVDLSSIAFVADIPLREVQRVRPGRLAHVRLLLMPSVELPSFVDASLPQTDVQSQSVKTRLRFRSVPADLRPILRTDIAGTARINVGTRTHALFVPKTALLRDDEKDTYAVVIVTADSLSQTIPVTVGVVTDSKVEVQSAELKAGMAVITTGNYALADSTKVHVQHSGR